MTGLLWLTGFCLLATMFFSAAELFWPSSEKHSFTWGPMRSTGFNAPPGSW